MKKLLLMALTLSLSAGAFAQDGGDVKQKAAETKATTKEFKDGWTKGGFFGANGSNVLFDNWAAGGSNQSGLVLNASLFAIKKQGIGLWENYLDAAYGVVKNGKSDFVKSEDKLVYQTKYGRRINDKLNYAALFNLNTTLFPAWDPSDLNREGGTVSDFLAQAFGYASVGLDYKPTSYLSVFASPITLKYTYSNSLRLAERFGIDSNSNLRTEMGWYLNAQIKKDIMKNVNWQSRIELFNSYHSDYVFKRIDVNWQNTINMKVNKYITVSFLTNMIYDDDVDVSTDVAGLNHKQGKQMRVQWKHFTGVGFSYKFGDKL